MANLRVAMDSAFYDLNISSPQTLDGSARFVPGEAFPLDGSRASRALRAQQLSFLSNGFPLGIIPSYAPTSQKELGSFALQSLLFKPSTPNWWLGLIGQFRPQKLISTIKADVAEFAKGGFTGGEEWELSAFKDFAKHFVDKSLFSLGLCTQLSLSPASSLLLSTEGHGERKGRRSKAMFFHKLPQHDITFEAAWPELFIDRNGGYWDVPEAISLNFSSLIFESGLRYRVGLHKNSGNPQAVNANCGDPPLALMPGLCTKAVFSYENSRDIWREKEVKKSNIRTRSGRRNVSQSYDVRLNEPHAAISGIVGGTCAAWLSGRRSSLAIDGAQSREQAVKNRSLIAADLFGSFCYTFQHGKFKNLYGDLTRVDARLNICSASAFACGAAHLVSNVFRKSSMKSQVNQLAAPRLNLILQQQVAGPIVFRVDSKLSLGSSGERFGPHIEDVMYSLSYSLRLLKSGKVVAWYSPKRKEGMVELRLYEF